MIRTCATFKNLAAVSLVAAAITTNATAATNGFIAPSFRSAPNSQYAYWENFTNAFGAPGNFPDQPGATTDATLAQFSPSAIVTGGNIYNPGGASAFAVAGSAPFALGTVALQARTLGNPLDYSSVALLYVTGETTNTLAPVYRYELSRAAGGISSLWQWNLLGLNISNYSIVFNGSAAHVSLDSVMLDVAAPVSANFVDNAAFAEQPFALRSRIASLSRWNYPFSDATSHNRPTASVFGALGNGTDFDTRDAQFLLGWNLTNSIPAGKGANNYLIRRARVTLTVAGNAYAYNDKLRDYRTYFPTNDPGYIAPVTNISAIELYGVGYRGGFTNNDVFEPWAATNYPQTGPWSADPDFSPFSPTATFFTNRATYAAGYNGIGVLVDVSNNVNDDGTNQTGGAFEVAPFAVGQTTNVVPGEIMAAHHQLTFELNLNDPLIYAYVQKGLHEGNLNFTASTLKGGSQLGTPTYPAFYTIFSPVAAPHEFPLLDIEGEIVRPGPDSDGDGLPDDWENFHFNSLVNTAIADTDGDGVNNLGEFRAGTVPVANTNLFKIGSLEYAPNATELRFNHAPSRQYSVAWSGDMQQWTTITNPQLTYSSAWLEKSGTNLVYPTPVYTVWRDTNAPSTNRYYRVNTQ